MLTFAAVTGFLGAGKTTTLAALARRWEDQGRRVAIITNDQGTDLVDTQVAGPAATGIGEVTGGCFCCRFDDLLDVMNAVVEQAKPDTVLAEAVGSCTDLQATVVRPMKQLHGDRFRVAPLVTVLDPFRYAEIRRSVALSDSESDLAYLFRQQLVEADVIAVNKSDLLESKEELRNELTKLYPGKPIVFYSARTGEGLDELINQLAGTSDSAIDLDVDYDRYANAEAQLAWLNQSFQLRMPAGFGSADWADAVLRDLSGRAEKGGWTIGHVKVSVTAGDAFSKLSLISADDKPEVDARAARTHSEVAATALVNARVACEPAELDAAVAAAVASADATFSTSANLIRESYAFKPGYPRPIHRMPATAG
ncbi:GTP-binding protein [Fodinicola feengrottensis]|uniref:GTP-binding protein n=1 Tax=Fodinicola feengrottensis TaxID=435914 RepID=A0ABN2GSH8_9ACTN|nr:GTP-binding protein [Fodinicola feengrottensis]